MVCFTLLSQTESKSISHKLRLWYPGHMTVKTHESKHKVKQINIKKTENSFLVLKFNFPCIVQQ